MAKKNRLEKFLSSIFRTHIDPENSEALDNSEDIENKVNEILELINGQESDANLSANTFDKSELISRLQKFAKGYQALYGRYDHLIGKLKKKVHNKRGENESFSLNFSSSDSDSDSGSEDFPSREKSEELQALQEQHEKTEKRNNELDAELSKLRVQAENLVQEMDKLSLQLAAADEEKEALRSENLNLTNKIEEREKALIDVKAEADLNLKSVTEDLSSKNAGLLSDNENLKYKLEAAEQDRAELVRRLEALDEKNGALNSEILRSSNRIQEAEKTIKNLTVYSELLKDSRAEAELLRVGNSELHNEIDDLTLKLEAANLQVTNLNKQIEVADQQKCKLDSELQQAVANAKRVECELERLSEETSMLQQNNTDLHNQNSDLGRRLEEARAEVFALQEKLGVVQSEAAAKTQDMAMHEKAVQNELELLRAQKRVFVEQLNVIRNLLSDNESLMKELEETLTSKIFQQETMLENLKCSFGELLNKCKQLKDQFQELHVKFQTAEIVCKNQSKEIIELMKIHNEVLEKLAVQETEKMVAHKEIADLIEQVQILEVKLRLSSQKLKITETEGREKEENHERIIQVLKERGKELEEQNRILLGKVKSVERDLMQVKEAVQTANSILGKGFQNLESFFDQNRIQILTRLLEYTEELKILRTKSEEQLQGRQYLENQIRGLTVRLHNKEGYVSLFNRQLENLRATLAAKQVDMDELRKRVKEKEEEMVAKNEEKKEAIRQLCLLIEYHRERCNHLLRYLSTMHNRGGRSYFMPAFS